MQMIIVPACQSYFTFLYSTFFFLTDYNKIETMKFWCDVKTTLAAAAVLLFLAVSNSGAEDFFPLAKSDLRDKIRGGWAGQVIGCTFGGPTEFQFKSTFIPESQPISWSKDAVKWFFKKQPGLYDDIYMDLTFVEVLEKHGLDAPAGVFAEKFAKAAYPLWHANQMARYNILRGIAPPQSGHWLNNPHADDIDFQIEADFAGLMSPGMVNAAAEICDRVGHIMNYGDGYYGGLYVAAMYSLAFVENDIERIVEKALTVIPPQSLYAGTIRAVVKGHKDHPNDWIATWLAVQRTWGQDVGCPEGVFRAFNIDAKINSAWVVMGLLYGNGDFGKTLSISARCGDDSDCNPATAGGILGTMIGFSRIPESWKEGLKDIESADFAYTKTSLAEAAELSFKHALEMIRRNGGTTNGEDVRIKIQEPQAVPREAGFEGHYPVERQRLDSVLNAASRDAEFNFDGIGFVLNGAAVVSDDADKATARKADRAILRMSAEIDDLPVETIELPLADRVRRPTLFWRYQLRPGQHRVRLKLQDSFPGTEVELNDVVIYRDRPSGPPIF
jgi:hypothetical protein